MRLLCDDALICHVLLIPWFKRVIKYYKSKSLSEETENLKSSKETVSEKKRKIPFMEDLKIIITMTIGVISGFADIMSVYLLEVTVYLWLVSIAGAAYIKAIKPLCLYKTKTVYSGIGRA